MTVLSQSLSEYKEQLVRNRLGLWLFIISEVFLFGGLLITRIVLWGDTRPHLEQGLAFVLTAVLLISSFFMNRAETAIGFGDIKEFKRSILLTIGLGTVFLIGVVALEWPTSHLSFACRVRTSPASGPNTAKEPRYLPWLARSGGGAWLRCPWGSPCGK